MRQIASSWILGLVIATTLSVDLAGAQELSLVVNPRTGEVAIQNGPDASIDIDGYLLTSPVPRFNPTSWDSLASDAIAGWFEGHAANNRLGEVNLESFSTIDAGATIDLGTPYLPFSPTQIGQLEPGFKFEYRVSGGGTEIGDVVFVPQNNVVLVVNSDGSAALQNQSQFDVTIDGYLITSPVANALVPAEWTSFANSGVAGPNWAESSAQPNRMGELTVFGSKFLPANGSPVPIGSPVAPSLIDGASDLILEYHIAGGGTVRGGILLAAASSAITLEGDYNGDGFVDAADYTVWRNHLGQDFTLTNENPAAMTPGFVDQEDYSFWKSRYGDSLAESGGLSSGATSSLATVPEPGTRWIAVLGGLWILVGRMSHRIRNASVGNVKASSSVAGTSWWC